MDFNGSDGSLDDDSDYRDMLYEYGFEHWLDFDPFFAPYDDEYDFLGDDDDEEEDDASYDYSSHNHTGLTDSELRHLQRSNIILEKFRKQRENDPSTDGVIKVEDQEFKIHKSVLQSSSSYFEAMFSRPFNELNEKCITIQGVTKETFFVILEFIYGSLIELTEETIPKIYQAADMFCIDMLIQECKQCFKENWRSYALNKACNIAELLKEDSVMQHIVDGAYYFLKEGSYSVDKYEQMPCIFVLKLLEDKRIGLRVSASMKLLEMLCHWFKHSPLDRLPITEDVINKLNITSLPMCELDKFKNGIVQLHIDNGLTNDAEKIKSAILNRCKNLRDTLNEINLRICFAWQEDGSFFLKEFNFISWEWQTHSIELDFIVEDCARSPNCIYVLGHMNSLCYDTVTKQTEELRDRPQPMKGFSSCTMYNKIYIAGGTFVDRDFYAKQILTYVTERRFWSRNARWQKPKNNCSMIGHNGCIYIVGGSHFNKRDKKEAKSSEIYRYTPQSRQVIRFGRLTDGCVKPKLAIYQNKLYVFPVKDSFVPEEYMFEVPLEPMQNDPNIFDRKYVPIFHDNSKLLGLCGTSKGIMMVMSQEGDCGEHIFIANFKPTGSFEFMGFLPLLHKSEKKAAASNAEIKTEKSWFLIEEYVTN